MLLFSCDEYHMERYGWFVDATGWARRPMMVLPSLVPTRMHKAQRPALMKLEDDMMSFGTRCWQICYAYLGLLSKLQSLSYPSYHSPDSLTVHLPHRSFSLEAGGKDRYGRSEVRASTPCGRQALLANVDMIPSMVTVYRPRPRKPLPETAVALAPPQLRCSRY